MKGFKPQKAFMGLISTGDTNAVISLRNLAWESIKLWRWKDYIDRTWMKKYKVRRNMYELMYSPSGHIIFIYMVGFRGEGEAADRRGLFSDAFIFKSSLG